MSVLAQIKSLLVLRLEGNQETKEVIMDLINTVDQDLDNNNYEEWVSDALESILSRLDNALIAESISSDEIESDSIIKRESLLEGDEDDSSSTE